MAAPERDLFKIAVIERHKSTGNIGLGLVTGFGLRSGALASSITHDSHNIIIVGASDEEMLLAARTVIAMGGGIVAVHGVDVLAQLPLPIAGLLSDQPFETVRAGMRALLDAARTLGCPLSDPYMAMAFLALPVIPALKLTDLGLVDVRAVRALSPVCGPACTRLGMKTCSVQTLTIFPNDGRQTFPRRLQRTRSRRSVSRVIRSSRCVFWPMSSST